MTCRGRTWKEFTLKGRFMQTATGTTALDRIAHSLAPLCVVLMEAFWGFPWLLWAGRWQTLNLGRAPLSFLSVVALVGISFLATKFLLSRSWSSAATRWAVLGLGLLAIFVVIRLEYGDGVSLFSTQWFVHSGRLIAGTASNPSAIIMALPTSAYFWWRGMLLGRAHEYNYVHSNIMFGAGSFVLLALIWVATVTSDSLKSMAGAIALHAAAFFFCGLVAMALGNLRNVQKRMRPEEPRTVSFGRWLPIVLGLVGVVVFIGVLIATLSSLNIAGTIGRIFHAASGFFGTVVEYVGIAFQYILIPFEWLASMLFLFISYIIRLFGGKAPGQTTGETAGTPPEIPPALQGNSPDALIAAFKWMFFAIAVVAVAVLIMRSLNKKTHHKREGKPDFEETRESMWSWRRLLNDMFLFFDRMLARLLPWRKAASALRRARLQRRVWKNLSPR